MSDLSALYKKQMKEYRKIEDHLLETIFYAFHIKLNNENIWKSGSNLLLEAELKEMMPLEKIDQLSH